MGSIRDAAFELFLEEAAELFTTLEEGLLQLEEKSAPTAEAVERLFRAAHTLKGSAALMKLTTVATIAHRLEDALEEIRDKDHVPSGSEVDAMLFALDQIREVVRTRGTEDSETSAGRVAEVERRLETGRMHGNPAAEGSPAPLGAPTAPEPSEILSVPVEAPRPERDDFAGGVRISLEKIESMVDILGQVTVTQNHLLNQVSTLEKMREEIDFAGNRLLSEVSRFSERYAYTVPEEAALADGTTGEFHELEFDRYDEINLFARKLREITEDIGEALRTTSSFFGGFTGEIESLDRLAREMKERVSETRTVQAGLLFRRFSRTLREISRQSGKELQLQISGAETPIDRALYDGLYDPLLHIIRNAVAHGIEPEQERIRQGKNGCGTIVLEAQRRGNTVDILIRDDGRGIQFERVRQRAIEKGFLSADQLPSERALLNILFQPGFSTSETADDVSGRGVGMNVVMDRLAALNGTIDIETRPGEGTTFRLSLPLSLIIVNVIQFALNGQPFVIPSTLVGEITNLPEMEVFPETVTIRDEEIPTVDLHALLGCDHEAVIPRFAIVVKSSGDPFALMVDRIINQEDTVIRPFGTLLKEIPHFAGTSIAGDGTLRLVLNPARISARSSMEADDASAVAPHPVQEKPQSSAMPVILVVDDSLSVRKYAAMTLEAHGFSVRTATHGMEALEIIDAEHVDFVISDLEMPVMHGYELLSELGRRGALSTLPVAILSSRAGERHREKALSLGACDYLVKPFEEESLVETVRSHLSLQ